MMGEFDRRSGMDPITFAVISNDISPDSALYHVAGRLGHLDLPEDYRIYADRPSPVGSLIGLLVSIAFFVLTVLSW